MRLSSLPKEGSILSCALIGRLLDFAAPHENCPNSFGTLESELAGGSVTELQVGLGASSGFGVVGFGCAPVRGASVVNVKPKPVVLTIGFRKFRCEFIGQLSLGSGNFFSPSCVTLQGGALHCA